MTKKFSRTLWSTRFNRYIVECKLLKDTFEYGGAIGFNRYIVECKYIYSYVLSTVGIDLIDT